MRTQPWEEGYLLIGIDPAQRVSGFAYRGKRKDSEGIKIGTYLAPDIMDANEVEAYLRGVAETFEYTKVAIAVEYPTWNAGASQVVRAAANTYIRLVLRIWPKAIIKKVDPNDWRKPFGYKDRPRGQSTKDYSLWIAQNAYGWAVGGVHDLAEAAMIVEWLRIQIPSVELMKKVTIKPAKKKRPPKR